MTIDKREKRIRRHRRVRAKVFGTQKRPRLSVFRSSKNVHLQLIDDETGKTLVSASTHEVAKVKAPERIRETVKLLTERAHKSGINSAVFDRSGYKYHGKVKQVAETARDLGLKL